MLSWALENGVDVVLHGHMHQPSFTYLQRPPTLEQRRSYEVGKTTGVAVCGLGSTGAARDQLGEVSRNVFGVLRLEDERLLVKMYEVDVKRPTTEGQLMHEFTVPFNSRVP